MPYRQYVDDVLAGRILVGKKVHWAVERHVRDSEHGHERGLYFDAEEAEFALTCFTFFKHSKGKWRGQSFKLSGWQTFIIASLFGWKRADGTRRFRRAYLEVARKNGKSTLLAGIAILLTILDGEGGAEVYAAATKREQAEIVFLESVRMVRASPELKELCTIYKRSIVAPDTDSKFEPLSSDFNSMDGLHVHGGIVDELHAHKTRDIWDVIDTATGARAQPLIVAITTAGSNQDGICYELRGYCLDVLNPDIDVDDDSWFCYVASLDDGDDWQEEAFWLKANPNLNVSVSLEDLRDKARLAARESKARNNFLTKHLNWWTQQFESWLSVELWDKCVDLAVTEKALLGRFCYGAFDLSEKIDLNAFCLIFPPVSDKEPYKILWRYWMPEEAITKYAEGGDYKYQNWQKAGLLTATSGAISDYAEILREILVYTKNYDVRQIGYDPWNANQIVTGLLDNGVEMVKINQNYQMMSEASKELEASIIAGKIAHNGDKVTRYCFDNAVIVRDNNGNMRPVKPKDRRKKVDGVVAAVMAMSRALLNEDNTMTYTGILSV